MRSDEPARGTTANVNLGLEGVLLEEKERRRGARARAFAAGFLFGGGLLCAAIFVVVGAYATASARSTTAHERYGAWLAVRDEVDCMDRRHLPDKVERECIAAARGFVELWRERSPPTALERLGTVVAEAVGIHGVAEVSLPDTRENIDRIVRTTPYLRAAAGLPPGTL